MASTAQVSRNFQPDSDVHITFEDQLKINQFARYNARSDEIKAELKSKQNEMKNLEDAVEELELLDDETDVPYVAGEVFVYLNGTDTNKALEEAKKKMENEIKVLENGADELKNKMSDLKAQLYGKFGSHINLEGDDD